MANGYVIPIDPSELANRFPAPDALLDDGPVEPEKEEEVDSLFSGESYEARIAPLLDRIPQREADLIYLYYIQKKRQADIADIFEVTQAAISYRLDRGLQRIKFLLSIPDVTEEEMRRDLASTLESAPQKGPAFQPIDVNILVGMWQTTCQSEVASSLGLTQGRVRHRFFKSVSTLKNLAYHIHTFDVEPVEVEGLEALDEEQRCAEANLKCAQEVEQPEDADQQCAAAQKILDEVREKRAEAERKCVEAESRRLQQRQHVLDLTQEAKEAGTAYELDLTNGELLIEANERFVPYSKIFSSISSKKFNILREVKLPQWAGRGGDTCS